MVYTLRKSYFVPEIEFIEIFKAVNLQGYKALISLYSIIVYNE